MKLLPSDFDSNHPLIICEGTCEEVIVKKLLSADLLVFPRANVIDITQIRGATQIQENFLAYDVDEPACIVRLLDSRKERFVLGSLYRERFPVYNFYTHPEIEMLAIIKEGCHSAYTKRQKSRVKPSTYCMNELKLTEIKQRGFLESYWDIPSLLSAIREYKRVSRIPRGELCLADLLKQDA